MAEETVVCSHDSKIGGVIRKIVWRDTFVKLSLGDDKVIAYPRSTCEGSR